uniref:Uncharacterized protein n=1 Tax=Oryza glumipatula TaxID=40148 RepID=A0A0E0AHQ8_9ORYZ
MATPTALNGDNHNAQRNRFPFSLATTIPIPKWAMFAEENFNRSKSPTKDLVKTIRKIKSREAGLALFRYEYSTPPVGEAKGPLIPAAPTTQIGQQPKPHWASETNYPLDTVLSGFDLILHTWH